MSTQTRTPQTSSYHHDDPTQMPHLPGIDFALGWSLDILGPGIMTTNPFIAALVDFVSPTGAGQWSISDRYGGGTWTPQGAVLNERTYMIPDGVEPVGLPPSIGGSRLFSSFTEVQNSFSLQGDVKATYGGFGGSAEVSQAQKYASTSNYFSDAEWSGSAYYSCGLDPSLTTANASGLTTVDAGFAKDVAALPSTFTIDQLSTFQSFFQTWGTHYVTNVNMGGMTRLFITAEDVWNDSGTTLHAAAQAWYEGIASGTVKSSWSNNVQTLIEKSALTFIVAGGSPETQLPLQNAIMTGGDGSTVYNNWVQTIAENPGPIAVTVAGVWELVGDADIQTALWDAFTYLSFQTLTVPLYSFCGTRRNVFNVLYAGPGWLSLSSAPADSWVPTPPVFETDDVTYQSANAQLGWVLPPDLTNFFQTTGYTGQFQPLALDWYQATDWTTNSLSNIFFFTTDPTNQNVAGSATDQGTVCYVVPAAAPNGIGTVYATCVTLGASDVSPFRCWYWTTTDDFDYPPAVTDATSEGFEVQGTDSQSQPWTSFASAPTTGDPFASSGGAVRR